MKNFKKVIAVLLTAVLLLTSAFAGLSVVAEGNNTATITVDTVAGTAGQIVDVPVKITTTGMSGVILKVTLDDGLAAATETGYTASADFPEVYADYFDGEYEIAMLSNDCLAVSGENLTLVTLNLAVAEDVTAEELNIAIEVAEGNACDADENDVALTLNNGKVTIEKVCTHENVTYTSNDNGTHNGVCECGETVATNEACDVSGENGACSKCGYVAVVPCEHEWVVTTATPAEGTTSTKGSPSTTKQGEITFKCSKCEEGKTEDVEYYSRTKCATTAAVYEGQLLLNFKAREDRMAELGEYTEAFIRFEQGLNAGAEMLYTYKDFSESEEGTAGTYAANCWTYPVKPMQLKDEIATQVFVKIGNVWYSGETFSYSFRTYADTILASEDTETTEKTLIVNMLRYGSKMQVLKKISLDNLCDAGLPAEYEALITTTVPSITGTWSREHETNKGYITIVASQFNLDMASRTTAKFTIRSDRYTANPSIDTFRVEAVWDNAKTGEEMVAEYVHKNYATEQQIKDSCILTNQETAGWFSFDFVSLSAYDLRQVVTFYIYDGENEVSQRYTASIENLISYGITQSTYGEEELDVYYALMNYSDAARAHFCK